MSSEFHGANLFPFLPIFFLLHFEKKSLSRNPNSSPFTNNFFNSEPYLKNPNPPIPQLLNPIAPSQFSISQLVKYQSLTLLTRPLLDLHSPLLELICAYEITRSRELASGWLQRLGVEILVSGFVFEEDDFIRPWEGQNDNLERYALQWESKNLIAVSTAIQDWLTSRIAMEFMKQGAMLTVLSALLTALAWPAALLSATDFIDSTWTIAIDRSDKIGKLLAEVLLGGLQGNRPVTLVGYSLGARVIFKCLQFLAETENNAELVEKVLLLGAPIAIKDENWEATRKEDL